MRLNINSNKVDSCFETLIWFFILIILLALLVCLFEFKQNFQDFDEFIHNLFKWGNIKENYSDINKRKLFLDNIINSIEIIPTEIIVKKDSKILVDSNFSIYLGNTTVLDEKKLVIEKNKRLSIPNGLRVLNLSKSYARKELKALDNVTKELFLRFTSKLIKMKS